MTDTLFSDPTIDCDPNNCDVNFNLLHICQLKILIIFDMLIISYQFFN